MTTTLRPIEPLQHEPDGTRSRRFQVCVNSRPVGGIHLSTSPSFGDAVARILDLHIEEPDRRRGRGTVAALAAEEVARGWGCKRVEASVPAEAEAALRAATALGYVVRNRQMEKALDATPPQLPAGSRGRALAPEEFDDWQEHQKAAYAESWISSGVPEAQAWAKAEKDYARLLPDGVATDGMILTVLEHEGARVGTLWVGPLEDRAFVYDIETDVEHRGRGHGRTLMLLAETQSAAAGWTGIRLNVFAGNTPAERLYESLGYETLTYHLSKDLL